MKKHFGIGTLSVLAMLLCSLASGLAVDFVGQTNRPPVVISLPSVEMDENLRSLATWDFDQDATAWRNLESQLMDVEQHSMLETTLISVLNRDSTVAARLRACKMLAIVGGEASLPVAKNLLNFGFVNSLHDVEAACIVLGASPLEEASDILRDALQNPVTLFSDPNDVPKRIQVINAVGNRRDRAAVALLTPFTSLERYNEETAVAALDALGKISSIPALDAISAAMAENAERDEVNERFFQVGFEALVTQADANKNATDEFNTHVYRSIQSSRLAPEYIRCAALMGQIRVASDGGVALIKQVLMSEDSGLMPTAIAAIEMLPAQLNSQGFLEILPGLPVEMQSLLVRALGKRSDVYAQKAIVWALSSDEELVRVAGIESAPAMPPTLETLKTLVQALIQHPAQTERITQSLVRFSKDELVDVGLVHILQKLEADVSQDVRLALIDVLGKRRSRLGVELLVAESTHGTPEVSKRIWQALTRVSTVEDFPRLVDALLQVWDDTQRSECAVYLAQFANRAAERDRLVTVLGSVLDRDTLSPGQTVTLVTLLAACPTQKSLELIASLRGLREQTVQNAVVNALSSWLDFAAWEPLLGIYGTTDNATHRAQVFRAMVELLTEQQANPTPELVQHYGELFGVVQTSEERKQLLNALSGVVRIEALDLAVKQLAQPDIRPEAEATVKRLAEALASSHPEASKAALEAVKNK